MYVPHASCVCVCVCVCVSHGVVVDICIGNVLLYLIPMDLHHGQDYTMACIYAQDYSRGMAGLWGMVLHFKCWNQGI